MNRGCILVTGAAGFIGNALCQSLTAAGRRVRGVVHTPIHEAPREHSADRIMLDVGPDTDWTAALDGVESIVHLAALAHVPSGRASPAEVRRINVQGTLQLARAAAAAGVRRLVFMSSIKVNGERTTRRPYTEDDLPCPEDIYGISKWEAEQGLRRISQTDGFDVVVLRPPLVYGPGVKGNFLRLMDWVARGWPLPLGSIHNRRSLVFTGNLVDAIGRVLDVPSAAQRTFLISDGEDISTPELIRTLAQALGVKPGLMPCPGTLLKLAASILGKRGEASRLTGTLQVDSSRIQRELGWSPPYTLLEGLAETARWYHARTSARARL